jgi:hypothetical protein
MTYKPLLPPRVGDDRFSAAMDYVYKELRRLEQEFYRIELPMLNEEPDKPRDGMIAFADGTSWNPTGGARGIYAYYSGAWHRLG